MLTNYYDNPNTNRSPLAELKSYYGKGFKFVNLGLGKYSRWMEDNKDIFEKNKTRFNHMKNISRSIVTEEELVDVIRTYLIDGQIKYVLSHIRKLYGISSFSKFGYGTFKEFIPE